MARIVIIGTSVAGHACCQGLAARAPQDEITVVTREPYPAYRPEALIEVMAGRMKEKDACACEAAWYAQHNISFRPSTEIQRVDLRRNRLSVKEGDKIEFDYLVVAAGERAAVPDLPGKTKLGVVAWYTLADSLQVRARIGIAHTVCLVGDPASCRMIADECAAREKEVKIIAGPRPADAAVPDAIEWVEGCGVSELIGEGAELRALKLSSGKVIGTSLVVFTAPRLPNSEFLKDSGLNLAQGYVTVNDAQRTSHERVFACGSICSPTGMQEAQAQGARAAQELIAILEGRAPLCPQTS